MDEAWAHPSDPPPMSSHEPTAATEISSEERLPWKAVRGGGGGSDIGTVVYIGGNMPPPPPLHAKRRCKATNAGEARGEGARLRRRGKSSGCEWHAAGRPTAAGAEGAPPAAVGCGTALSPPAPRTPGAGGGAGPGGPRCSTTDRRRDPTDGVPHDDGALNAAVSSGRASHPAPGGGDGVGGSRGSGPGTSRDCVECSTA